MPPDDAPLMQARGVDAGYGTMQVLWGVDLDVRAGETVLLLGANGAGKTTFLKSLVGLIEARHGSIHLGGEDLTRMRSSDRMKLGMTYMSELAVFPDLSIRVPASRNSMAYSRRCAKNAGRRRPHFPAASARCSASPRRSPPNPGCW
jgi:ABC-type branched-subunit amino acid transport system ATPase component